jgi:integrase/recombinase XerD
MELKDKSSFTAITRKDMLEYQKVLLHIKSTVTGKLLATVTIYDRFNAVKLLFSVLYRAGVIKNNVTHGLTLEIPNRIGWKRRAFTREEINYILESLDVITKQGLRDRALFELIYSSGLRVSEASKLYIRDINFERREMIVRGKFDRDRIVPISRVAKRFLQLYLKERLSHTVEPVFTSVYKTEPVRGLKPESISEHFRDLLRRFDLDKKEVSTHSIRHSTATHLLDNGASIRHVQELLGHQNLETTVRYTHVQTDGLFRIFRRYHPREHDLFEMVNEEYRKRLDALGDKKS